MHAHGPFPRSVGPDFFGFEECEGYVGAAEAMGDEEACGAGADDEDVWGGHCWMDNLLLASANLSVPVEIDSSPQDLANQAREIFRCESCSSSASRMMRFRSRLQEFSIPCEPASLLSFFKVDGKVKGYSNGIDAIGPIESRKLHPSFGALSSYLHHG